MKINSPFIQLLTWLPIILNAQDFWEQTNGPYWNSSEGLVFNTIFSLTETKNEEILAGGEFGYIHRTTDNGANWSTIFIDSIFYAHVFSLEVNSSGNLFAGTERGVYRSLDNGESWVRLESLDRRIGAIAFNSSGHIFAGTFGIYKSTNNGNSWMRKDIGLPFTYTTSFIVTPDNNIFAGTYWGAYYSTDDGDSWSLKGLDNTDVLSLAMNSNGDIYAGTYDYGFFKSTDNGVTWKQSNDGLTNIHVHSIALNSLEHIYVGTFEGGVFYSSNNGGSWNPVSDDQTSFDMECILLNTNDNVLAGTRNSGVIRSRFSSTPVELKSFTASNKNNTVILKWTTATEKNNYGFEIQRAIDSDYLSIGFVKGNGTTSEINSYEFEDKNLSSGSYKYVLIQIDYDGTRKEIAETEIYIDYPNSYKLHQNYPNPFNPITKIEFDIIEESDVNFFAYNVLGELIYQEKIINIKPGRHHIIFSGRDLASGLYFYQIKSVDFMDTKEMLLLK